MVPDARREIAPLIESLKEALARVPDDYESRVTWAIEFQRAVTQALAEALEQPMNRYVVERPTTFAQRAGVVDRIRQDCAQLLLGISCPKTARPAMLYVQARDSLQPDHAGWWYSIRHRDPATGRAVLGHAAAAVPQLRLIPSLDKMDRCSRTPATRG